LSTLSNDRRTTGIGAVVADTSTRKVIVTTFVAVCSI
jgi:hypothetical protein